MALTEDSVVSSLNELRRMASDRARRETAVRSQVAEQRGHGGRRQMRTTEIPGAGDPGMPQQSHTHTMTGGMAGDQGGGAPGYGYGGYGAGGYGAGGYGHTAQPAGFPETYSEPIKQKSSAGPVLLTILILGGAATGGYLKLQQDWNATLNARDAAILSAEEARNKAVELASKTEQLYKSQLASCEARGKAAAPADEKAAPAAATAPAAAAVVTPPASAAKPAKMSRAERLAAKRAARHAKRAAAAHAAPPPPTPAVEEKKPSGPMPKIAGKKKISDDPLAGLKL